MRQCPPARSSQRGFTLIELMTVVIILGLLAAVAVGAYRKNIRNAHKSEVIGDLSSLSLKQKSFFALSGHYASSTDAEDQTYPAKTDVTNGDGRAIVWDTTAAGYTAVGKSGAYFRGGEQLHGFDALRFLPENGRSLCGYGTISGHGTNAVAPDNDIPSTETLAAQVFPRTNELERRNFARDWFYSFALCDFDLDGTFWAFTSTHATSDVSSSTDATQTYREYE